MLSTQFVLPAGKAYARALYSKRQRCHVVPLVFVRVACRVASLNASKRRMRAAFADYLVTDHEPAFSDRRKAHDYGVDAYASTCDRQAYGLGRHGYGYQGGGPLDAPELIAGGSVVTCGPDGEGGLPAVVDRGKWSGLVVLPEADLSGPFSSRRGWHEYPSPWKTGYCHARVRTFAEWVIEDDKAGLDAPDTMPAGAMRLGCILKNGCQLPWSVVFDRGAA